MPYTVDEAGLFLNAIGAIAWYLVGRNKFTQSIVPLLFILCSLAFKITGFILEIADNEDIGDEHGA